MKILGAFLLASAFAAGFQNQPSRTNSPAMQSVREVSQIERASLDGFLKGDTGPALSAIDEKASFFHVMTEKRADGGAAIEAIYAGYTGRPLYDRYEMEQPLLQPLGDVVVYTYVLVTHNGELTRRWNVTQIYQRKTAGWKVVHSHFAATLATRP